MSDLKSSIRNVPDFPKPGIGFKDITTLLIDGPAFREAVDLLAERFQNQEIKKVVG
ncbi:MAG: adenine phosphoribosyltransferase, partial [Calditrichaeota bacterium]|nr:adenine phosphoribosyltransferase [Calditrichota bacterium]